jgi:hypothetical protein
MVGLLRRGISQTKGLYLHRTAQHRKTKTNIHAVSRIRTRDPSAEVVHNGASFVTLSYTVVGLNTPSGHYSRLKYTERTLQSA